MSLPIHFDVECQIDSVALNVPSKSLPCSLMSESLSEAAKNVLIFRRTIVGTASFVTYEYLINFDNEARYLWRRRFNFGSILLFLCRYLPIAQIYVSMYDYVLTSDLRASNCSTLLKANSALVYIQFCISIIVLYTRAYVVWGGDRRVSTLLVSSYIVCAAGTAYTVHLYLRGAIVLGLRLWNGCIFLISDHTIFYALIGHAMMDILALSLLLYKSVQHARAIKSLKIERGDSSAVSLLAVMAQDGIAYFILNFLTTIMNMIILERAPEDLRDFLMTTQACVQNVFCARLQFHIQSANERWNRDDTVLMTSVLLGSSMEMKKMPQCVHPGLRRKGDRSGVQFVDSEMSVSDGKWEEDTSHGEVA